MFFQMRASILSVKKTSSHAKCEGISGGVRDLMIMEV